MESRIVCGDNNPGRQYNSICHGGSLRSGEGAGLGGQYGAPPPAKGAAPAPAHQELFWPEFWETFHHPTPWLSMGLDERLRYTMGQNWDTLNDDSISHDWQFERYRTRWWTKWTVNEDININTRLVWEPRTWQEPATKRIPNWGNFDEALFDWFNVNMRNIGGLPLSATIGRQDMIFGVGWLVLDGTPLDGSRTIFFDAARFTYEWGDANTRIDAAYIRQMAETDDWLEPICNKDRALIEQDENGALLWLTNTSFKPTQLEGFFIYRNDNPVDEQFSNLPPQWSRKAEIYTVGAAVSGTQGDHWKYRAEAALQRGTKYDGTDTLGVLGTKRDLKGYGTLDTLEYQFKDAQANATHVTYEYASGDDPSTEDNEQFDPLWGEWPRWSELLIYTATFETEPADLTNLQRFNIGHRLNLNKQWQLTMDYDAIWADQPGQPWKTGPNGINVSNSSHFRGNLFTSWLKYKFTDQLYGHFLGEYFIPGDYYVSPSDDNAWFFRFDVEYTF